MHRESRDRLYHRIISDIKFDRHLAIGLTNAQIYQLTERFCELVCNDAVMVVRADLPGFSHGVAGKFGKDEPWPEWVNRGSSDGRIDRINETHWYERVKNVERKPE